MLVQNSNFFKKKSPSSNNLYNPPIDNETKHITKFMKYTQAELLYNLRNLPRDYVWKKLVKILRIQKIVLGIEFT